jgi:DNA-binding SARP family transcriptional activator
VETQVESALSELDVPAAGLRVRMLGSMIIARDGSRLELPASRKVLALFAYLALAPHPVGRSRLCELLWDIPNDPRGELRWCLSKLRTVLDEPDHHRVVTSGDTIAVDLHNAFVDVLEIDAATRAGIEQLDADRLRELAELFVGDFLDGLEIDRSPHFDSWLIAQRRRLRACHLALLEHLIQNLPSEADETLLHLEKWVELAPFDGRAQVMLLGALAGRGRIGECEEHLEATARLFEAEDVNFAPVREAWRTLKGQHKSSAGSPATVSASPVGQLLNRPAEAASTAPRRASVAIMPFLQDASRDGLRGGMADGLTHDIISRLARLRSLFVIARGSVFALAERNLGPEEAGRRLNVDYIASGAVRQHGDRVVVAVELVEVRTARIVCAESFECKPSDAFSVLDEIGDRIVSAIASEIEAVEQNRAILKPPNSLDAWEAYHRGLWHMYRFTKPENDLARHFFQMSVRLDPTFARAHAGLSFTHWQSAFQRWGDREQEMDLAFAAAGQSLLVDDHNPASHWAMGRALWLRGRHEDSLQELGRSVDLSPNFALGHYALSFVQSQSGDPLAAIESSDHSRSLSPFDPLLFAMLGARAMAHVRLGQFDEAADWALRAAARPNAHVIILAIAAHCLALAGRLEEGRSFAGAIRKTLPQYCVDDFLDSFRFPPDVAALFRQGASRIGLG